MLTSTTDEMSTEAEGQNGSPEQPRKECQEGFLKDDGLHQGPKGEWDYCPVSLG